MPLESTRRIIAVFGGSTETAVVTFARDLGATIAGAGQILLTGGTGPRANDSGTVKNCAIKGAGSAPWVGVERKATGGPECDDEGVNGLVMTLNLGHKRNYLEALMCDAAIALPGGKGTTSEAISALSLHRPVAFVGDAWKPTWDALGPPDAPAAGRAAELDKMWTMSVERLCDKDAENHALDRRIDGIPTALKRPGPYTWFCDDATTADVLRWICGALPKSTGSPGGFPEDVDPRIAGKYCEWLHKHAATKA